MKIIITVLLSSVLLSGCANTQLLGEPVSEAEASCARGGATQAEIQRCLSEIK